jgi:hypothetical protein
MAATIALQCRNWLKGMFTVCIRANKIAVLDKNMREVVKHKRFYWNGKQESIIEK